MIILDVNKVSKDFGYGKVLDNINLVVNEGERVAIVGENGTGKSTLLSVISGEDNANSGIISFKKDTTLEILHQTEPDKFDDRLVKEVLNDFFKELNDMEERLNSLQEKMMSAEGDELNILIDRYSRLQERFSNAGGYTKDVLINTILNGLKIDNKLLERNYNSLSGGEKTLIHFAGILLKNPNLLLLDEPTNHLDMDRINWLESYLLEYKGTVIVVSHDRYFLDKVATKVFYLSDESGKMYVGNYSSYLKEFEEEQVKQFEIFKVQQKKISAMEETIKKLKEWGKISDNPMFFRRAKAIQSYIDRLKEVAVEKPKEKRALPINFSSTNRAGDLIVHVKNYNFSYNEKPIFKNLNFVITNAEKVAIIGKNGTGKTTLINKIVNRAEGFYVAKSAKIGYLPQLLTFENYNLTVLEHFISSTGIAEEKSRSILSKFMFYKNSCDKRLSSLSGGEKIRLKLAVLLQQEINVLIFDEPTNHIDISTKEVLEESLKSFSGTIIFVSHDRYFINSLATKIIEIENYSATVYNGNYDYYLAEKAKSKEKINKK